MTGTAAPLPEASAGRPGLPTHPLLVPALLDAAGLQDALERPDVVPVEVAVDPARYYRGHVPGAAVLDWFDDLHSPDRRGVVPQARFEELLGERGIGPDTHVVLYDDGSGLHAGYAFWLSRYYGHARLSLLDGGRRAWSAAGGALVREEPRRASATYRSPGPEPRFRVMRDELLASFVPARAGTVLLDGRPPEAFTGRAGSSPGDLPLLGHRLAGHIPGATNLPVEHLLDASSGRFLDTSVLRQVFTGHGVRHDSAVAVYCSVGEQSSVLWFALHELLAHPVVRHYDGGWAEYGSLVDVPVAR